MNKISTGLLTSTAELRKLIIENPDLPLLVFACQDAHNGEMWEYMCCSCVSATLGEVLDFEQEINDEKVYTDRDDFEEDVADWLYDDFERTDEGFEKAVKKRVALYDPYWKPCIILYVDN